MAETNEISEKPLTRRETTRSIEDAEKYRALNTLINLGLLVPINQVDTFHGRVGKKDETWAIDPTFANHGNNTGNQNVNQRSTLYSSDAQTAEDFARARQKTSQEFQTEVHEILTADLDATVIDISFDSTKLSEEDQLKYTKALQAIAIPITEGSPVDFNSRDALEKFINAMNQLQKNFVLVREVGEIAKAAGVSEQTALQLSSAFNARQVALKKPSYLADRLLRYPSDIFTDTFTINGEQEEAPINLEYAERYMREAHIIAAKQSINSVTLTRDVTSVSFFDLERIGTREQLEVQQRAMLQKMVGLMDKFPPLPNFEATVEKHILLSILKDAHAKPEKLVEAAKLVGEFGNLYDSDAGNWEGFTLGEHTETVLRNFDENFADIVPVEYLAPMRLAILAHDLGKPIAVANGEKSKQKVYNAIQAKNFLNALGVEPRVVDLLTAVVTDGSDLAFKQQIQPGNPEVETSMKKYAEDVLRKYLNKNNIDEFEIESFIQMCKIFQLCDGGAYTSMAITRRDGKGRYRNAPSFNKSFASPIGLGKRDIKYPES